MNDIYEISFQKKQVINQKLCLSINFDAKISVNKKESAIPNTMAVDFETLYFDDKAEKDSLCFTPLHCIYSFDEKKIVITNKDKQKSHWNRYKKKHENKKELRVLLMLYEELFFKAKDGLENHLLSSGAILAFCVSFLEKEYEYDVYYKGISFLWTTLSIPFVVEYFIQKGLDNYDIVKAKLKLYETKFAEIISNKRLQGRIKSFILKKEFSFDSYLKIKYNNKENKIASAEFKLIFNDNEKKFSENTFIPKKNGKSLKNTSIKILVVRGIPIGHLKHGIRLSLTAVQHTQSYQETSSSTLLNPGKRAGYLWKA
jgi:hypothetical protein